MLTPSTTEPIKWKKHLKLVEYGLREYQDLISEIHRYHILKISEFYSAIKQEILCDIRLNKKAFYIIKMVNNNKYYKLPNYRVYTIGDLDEFLLYINPKKHLYDELWYCRTQYSDEYISLNVSGRISFDYEHGQTIEQVWNRSPRVIEEYNNSSDFIYLRASRLSWGFRYITERIHIPKSLNIDSSTILSQFFLSAIEIERKREKLDFFVEYIFGYKFHVFSIEYKIANGKLSILDWDTHNDSLILR